MPKSKKEDYSKLKDYGTIKFENGSYYHGQVQNDRPHGKGKLIEDIKENINSRMITFYNGFWINGKKNGYFKIQSILKYNPEGFLQWVEICKTFKEVEYKNDIEIGLYA